MTQVSIRDVRKSFGRIEVIHGIDLEIEQGRMTVLLGPSGCGKSTLLRMIAGLEEITTGEIAIDGQVVNETAASARGCAMVFQNYALYPHQTVYKNLAFPLRMAGHDRTFVAERVKATARMLQLETLLDRLPRDLSGGQRQRVAMGRAMIREPKVYLFDEPLSNLDAELRVRMRLEIARLQQTLSATMVFVTHDQVEAMTLAHKIVVMRDGIIEQTGSPLDVYDHPANQFVAGFVGTPAMNFLDVESAETNGAETQLRLAGGTDLTVPQRLADHPARVGVRPEHLQLMRDAAPTQEVELPLPSYDVIGTEHLGDRSYTHIRTPFGELTVLSSERDPIGTPADLRLAIQAAGLRYFDGSGKAIGAAS